MHILLIYMYYLRPGDPGIKRFNEFCPLWLAKGAGKVTVLTGQLHHNTGRVYPDLAGKEHVVERVDGVEIHRLSGPDTYYRGFAGRAWSQALWARHVQSYLHHVPRPDVVLAVSPHLWHAWPLVAAKRMFDAPAVLELADIWPEVIVKMGIAPAWHPGIKYLQHLERWAYRHSDHLVTTAESQRQNIVQRGLKDAGQVTVVNHGIRLADYENTPPEARPEIRKKLGVAEGELLVMYVGSHGPWYNLIKFVELAEALTDRPDIKLVSVGEGTDRLMLQSEVARRGLKNVQFPGPVPVEQVPAYLSAADIACSMVNAKAVPGWNEETTGIFRSALFDYAGARLPVVFNDPGHTVRELRDRAQAGLYANTDNGAGELAGHVRYLADHPEKRRELGENNYREIAVRYNRERMAELYLEIMRHAGQ